MKRWPRTAEIRRMLRTMDPRPPRDGDGGDPPTPPPDKAPDLGDFSAEAVQSAKTLLARHGHPLRALATVLTENHGYREERRKLKEDLDKAKGQLPTDGSVAIPKGEADLLEEYKALGPVADLKKATEELPKLREFKEETEEGRKTAQAADAEGWKASVLGDLGKAKGLRFETREETVKEDGEEKKVSVAYVFEGDSKTPVKLSEYGEKNLADYLPSLRKEGGTGGGQEGTRFPGSPGRTQETGKPGSLVEKRLEARKKKDKEKSEAVQKALSGT